MCSTALVRTTTYILVLLSGGYLGRRKLSLMLSDRHFGAKKSDIIYDFNALTRLDVKARNNFVRSLRLMRYLGILTWI